MRSVTSHRKMCFELEGCCPVLLKTRFGVFAQAKPKIILWEKDTEPYALSPGFIWLFHGIFELVLH